MILILPIISLIITIASFIAVNKKGAGGKNSSILGVNVFLIFSILSILPTIQTFVSNGNLQGGGSELAVRGLEYFLLSLVGLVFGLVACLSSGVKNSTFMKRFKIATFITYLPLALFVLFLLLN